MKAIIVSALLCALGCVESVQAVDNKAPTEIKNPEVKKVDLEFVQKAIKQKQDIQKGELVIIDARTSEYLMEGGPMIPGAINIPHDADKDVILKTLPNKNAQILIYCGGIQCPAGSNLAKRLIESGYKNVSDFPGGMKAWQDAGLTTQQKK